MIEHMGKRRRRSSSDSFWTREYGGMPVWGLVASVAFLAVAAAFALPAALSQPQAEARQPGPIPTFTYRAAPDETVVSIIGDSYTAGSPMDSGTTWAGMLDLDAQVLCRGVRACGGRGEVEETGRSAEPERHPKTRYLGGPTRRTTKAPPDR